MAITRSGGVIPAVTTATVSVWRATVTGFSTALSSSTPYTKAPFGPRWIAAVGTVTAPRVTSTVSRTFTKLPGQSWRSPFGKVAFSFTVPVVASTWLSTTSSRPRSSTARLSDSSASTASGPLAAAAFTARRFCCGRLNRTVIGLSWVITTIPVVSAARTRLPWSTSRMPVRPSSGDTTVV